MKTKKDFYASGKKLPWHFDNDSEFYPKVVKTIQLLEILIYIYTLLNKFYLLANWYETLGMMEKRTMETLCCYTYNNCRSNSNPINLKW